MLVYLLLGQFEADGETLDGDDYSGPYVVRVGNILPCSSQIGGIGGEWKGVYTHEFFHSSIVEAQFERLEEPKSLRPETYAYECGKRGF